MEYSLFSLLLSSTLLLLLLLPSPCSSSDPDPLQDFCVANLNSGATSSSVNVNGFPCKPSSSITSEDFFFSGLSKEANSTNAFGFAITAGSVLTYPALNTLGLSMNRVDYAPGGVIPPHTHPRASELLLVTKGRLLAGFVTTGGVLYSKVVKEGENYLFPRGLTHFQYNVGKGKAAAVVVFNSQLPGGVVAAPTIFGSKPAIPTEVLAKSFLVDLQIINTIKSKFAPPSSINTAPLVTSASS